MINPLATALLREIPHDLLAGVSAGKFRVCGSVIQSVTSGRIVGHLQETSGLPSILSSLLNLNPFGVPQMVMQAVSVVQNEQVKAAISVVQTLQVANLALSGASIGVSIAGTALLARRIVQVEEKVEAILPAIAEITRKIEGLREDRVVEDFTRLRTLVDQVDEAWLPSATRAEWIDIAKDAHALAGRFENRTRELGDLSYLFRGEPFIDAFALASGLRVTARLAAGQDDMARQASAARAKTLFELGEPVSLGRLVLARMSDDAAATLEWQERMDRRAEEFRIVVSTLRERELAAAATAETLEELARQGISGRAWLEASRSENERPVLFLPVDQFDD